MPSNKETETYPTLQTQDVITKVLDCCLELSELELQSHYYIHFRTNTIGKGINPLIPLSPD